MTIEKAIAKAKSTGNWFTEPTSVNVGFYNYTEERDDETQFDLQSDNENELASLWQEQYAELESKLTGVLYVEPLGYIENDCAMGVAEFKKVQEKCKELLAAGWEIPLLIACIHDLWDGYHCSEKQEYELYNLVDPDEQFNEVCDYYPDGDYENPLLEITEAKW